MSDKHIDFLKRFSAPEPPAENPKPKPKHKKRKAKAKEPEPEREAPIPLTQQKRIEEDEGIDAPTFWRLTK